MEENYGPGSRGEEVAEIQRQLRATGHNPGKLDGIYGKTTESAVRAFQKSQGLTADGMIGPETLKALFSLNEVLTEALTETGDDLQDTETGAAQHPNQKSADPTEPLSAPREKDSRSDEQPTGPTSRELWLTIEKESDPSTAAQLNESLALAEEFSKVAGPIDTILLLAGLLFAPDRGEQEEESWAVLRRLLQVQYDKLLVKAGDGDPRIQLLGLDEVYQIYEIPKIPEINEPEVSVRNEVFAVVSDAGEFSRRSQTRGRLSVRHLLAMIIWGRTPRARNHLVRMGYDLETLKYDYFKNVTLIWPEEKDGLAELLRIDQNSIRSPAGEPEEKHPRVITPETMKTPVGPRIIEYDAEDDDVPAPVFAGYAADSPYERDDLLGIKRDVNAIATILAARSVPLPLSLGLFGDWGTGKTFFMNRLFERINLLADRSRGKPAKETAYHGNIIQIRFNAWHYIDADLWASLVTHILDDIYEYLSEDTKDPWEEAVKNLEGAKGLHDEAKHGLTQARNAVNAAEKSLQSAQENREKREQQVETRFNSLKNLLEGELQTQLQDVLKQLGLAGAVQSFNDLTDLLRDVRTRTGRLTGFFSVMANSKYAVPYIGLLLLILLLPIGIAMAVPRLVGETGVAGEVGVLIGQIGSVIVGVAAWLRKPLKWLSSGIEKLEAVRDKAEEERKQRQLTEQVEADRELAVLREKERAAREGLQQAEKRLQEAELELEEAQPSRRLYRLIEGRTQSEDYRSRLGIISLIRNDFERLSGLINPTPVESVSKPAAAGAPQKNPIPIDRIILYIDDLDRCPAARVVQVLEAVHLLLAFPIFVVVVGVDPRWLRRSLELRYPHLLTGVFEDGDRKRISSGARAATPQNYLEKIFQIPFNLRPMGKRGYERLVQKLMETADPAGENDDTSEAPAGVGESPKTTGQEARTAGERGPKPDTPPALEREQEEVEYREGADKEIEAETRAETEVEKADRIANGEGMADDVEFGNNEEETKEDDEIEVPEDDGVPDLNPPALVLTPDEKLYIQKLHRLFRTPRTTKRFINTYRIFRARLQGAYLQRLVEDEEYRCAMVLLGIITGFPVLASKAMRILFEQSPDATWNEFVTNISVNPPVEADFPAEELPPSMQELQNEWQRMSDALQTIKVHNGESIPVAAFLRWLPQVARYSFSIVLPAWRAAEHLDAAEPKP
jgi:hypothetical protein